MTVGMPVPPSLEVKKAVSGFGKLATALSPMMTRARPRNSARVPIVTAREGSPRTAIRKPLNMPAAMPASRLIARTSQMSMPAGPEHAHQGAGQSRNARDGQVDFAR